MHVFYYQQGSSAQALAAAQLRAMGWRFHRKYLTWFKLNGEGQKASFAEVVLYTPPLLQDYYQGAIVYFDHLNDWAPRVREDFTLEHVLLEDP